MKSLFFTGEHNQHLIVIGVLFYCSLITFVKADNTTDNNTTQTTMNVTGTTTTSSLSTNSTIMGTNNSTMMTTTMNPKTTISCYNSTSRNSTCVSTTGICFATFSSGVMIYGCKTSVNDTGGSCNMTSSSLMIIGSGGMKTCQFCCTTNLCNNQTQIAGCSITPSPSTTPSSAPLSAFTTTLHSFIILLVIIFTTIFFTLSN